MWRSSTGSITSSAGRGDACRAEDGEKGRLESVVSDGCGGVLLGKVAVAYAEVLCAAPRGVLGGWLGQKIRWAALWRWQP